MKYIGLISSAASGKMGGVVASHNRSGSYLRRHVMPVQPRTAIQSVSRAQLAAFSSAFKSLTTTQVAGWNALGSNVKLKNKLGVSFSPTGQQLFVSCNRNLAAIGVTTTLTTAPSQPSIPAITAFSATPVYTSNLLTSITLAFSPSMPANFGAILRATKVQSNGRTFAGKSLFRTISGVYAASTLSTSISTAYTNVFGPWPGTGYVGFEVRLVDPASGFAGPYVRAFTNFTSTATTNLFTLAVGNQTGTTTSGSGTVTFTATPTAVGSFSGALTYEVTGLPSNCTFTVNHNPYTVASPVTVSVVAASATAGTSTINIIASYGSFSVTVPKTLTIA